LVVVWAQPNNLLRATPTPAAATIGVISASCCSSWNNLKLTVEKFPHKPWKSIGRMTHRTPPPPPAEVAAAGPVVVVVAAVAVPVAIVMGVGVSVHSVSTPGLNTCDETFDITA
jgi:hypothetical protein